MAVASTLVASISAGSVSTQNNFFACCGVAGPGLVSYKRPLSYSGQRAQAQRRLEDKSAN